MQEHHTTVAQGNVAYWDTHTPNSPVVVLIHGYRGTHHGLLRIIEQLPDARVIAPDLPGFGQSEPFHHEPHSVDQYVLFVVQFIQALNLDQPPVLLGHSFGSIVASHAASEHPEILSKLILINPISAPALEGPRGILTQFARLYYAIGKHTPERFGRAWLSWPVITDIMTLTMTKSHDPAMKAYVKDQHRRYFSRFASARTASEAFDASVSNDVRSVAPHISARTLLIAGEQDDITHLEDSKKLHALFPQAELITIQDVGHLIHYEKAAEAAAAIRSFISEDRDRFLQTD